jgi:hypothetical protein
MQKSLDEMSLLRTSYEKTRNLNRFIGSIGSTYKCGPEIRILTESFTRSEEHTLELIKKFREDYEVGTRQIEKSCATYFLISASEFLIR